MIRDFSFPHRPTLLEVLRGLLDLAAGDGWSLREIDLGEMRWRLDIATASALHDDVKQVIRDAVDNYRYPGCLIKIGYGRRKP